MSSIEPQPSPAKRRKLSPSSTSLALALPAPSTAGSPASQITTAEPAGGEFTVVMSKKHKSKEKKKKKELQKATQGGGQPPFFSFNLQSFDKGRRIRIVDLRDLVLNLFGEEKAQPWLYVKNVSAIQRAVVLLIPGITLSSLGLPERGGGTAAARDHLPFSISPPPSSSDNSEDAVPESAATAASQLPAFQALFTVALPTLAPGDNQRMHSAYQAFTNVSLSASEQKRREQERKIKGQKQRTTDPSVYLLPLSIMAEQGYPLPTTSSLSSSPPPLSSSSSDPFSTWQKPDGWIETPFSDMDESKPWQVLGVDCEMCLTSEGSEIVRVTLVDFSDLKTVYDTLVKPGNQITDYLTRYSGITEEELKGVEVTLEMVQRKLSGLLGYRTVLVGHSLESDLRALKLTHPWVIDTSILYQHPRGPPFKASLKWLAQKWLHKEIQTSSSNAGGLPGITAVSSMAAGEGAQAAEGHSSEEDARTCVELLQLKMEKGPGFGEFTNDQQTIYERLSRSGSGGGGGGGKTSAVVDHGTPAQWYGSKAKTTVGCTNDEEVLKGVMGCVEEHSLTVARFLDVSHALGWSQPSNAVTGRSSVPGLPSSSSAAATPDGSISGSAVATPEPESLPPSSSTTTAAAAAAYATLNSQIARLHSALPPLTALIIFTGHSDPREMSRLAAKKARFDRLFKTVKISQIKGEERWLQTDDDQLREEVARCKKGLSFFNIK